MLKQVRPELQSIDRAEAGRVIEFGSGRTVTLESGTTDRLMVTDPNGRFEIAIRFTEAGPVLDVSAIALNVRTDAAVVLDCDRFHVSARDQITLETRGDLVERVAGDHRTVVEGESSVSASRLQMHADDGDVEIAATEDARIDARRVLLNC